ncbi:IclR family transcriptional regulator [Sciscionella sediminilitoris]|uniref:IclR family transcriptional regulator n=1 Tax=Sciscionella sediminilitoris TaxID=1445613 RepID=UPI0004DF20AF|nr:IclR family transcriptional regulator [Sciscionella sp. SE31]
MENPPPYPLKSVDNALHAAALLQQEGALRVTDIAERLTLSPSTAHRLLSMLVYREFATQDADRRYHPGPLLRQVDTMESSVAVLRRIAGEPMARLVGQVNETAQLMVAVGGEARFVRTVECDQVLRVTDRAGRAKPLHLTSAGKAMLAAMEPERVTELYRTDRSIETAALRHELNAVRENGFALNHQRTETGLTAIGVAITVRPGTPCAGLALAMPTARFHTGLVPELVTALRAASSRIEAALRETPDFPV